MAGDTADGEEDEAFLFEVSLEIRENIRSGGSNSGPNGDKDAGFEVVPRQKGIFKLRSNVEKKVVVSVQQVRTGLDGRFAWIIKNWLLQKRSRLGLNCE